MSKLNYKVIEDNGGGLSLFVFRGDAVIYAGSGYEYRPGALQGDLAALEAGDDTRTWEGNADDPQAALDDTQRYEYGWETVCEGGPRQTRRLYPDRMGAAARIEFDPDEEELTVPEADTLTIAAGTPVSGRGLRYAAARGLIQGARKVGRDWLLPAWAVLEYARNAQSRRASSRAG
jgi:hypothetical protein